MPRGLRFGAMKTVASILTIAALALGACAETDDPEPAAEKTTSEAPSTPAEEPSADAGDDRVWPQGNALSEYKGFASYEWRVNVLDNADEVLAAMQKVNPDLEEKDFNDVIGTCESIDRGIKGDALVEETKTRFDVTDPAGAKAMIQLARTVACP